MVIPLLFSISGGELVMVLLFVLLFFGSKGIPDVARTMGRLLRQVRDASQEVQREIHKGASEVRREVEDQRRSFQAGLPNGDAKPPPDPDSTDSTKDDPASRP
jgi:Sec-independent protein translocase protein TatA